MHPSEGSNLSLPWVRACRFRSVAGIRPCYATRHSKKRLGGILTLAGLASHAALSSELCALDLSPQSEYAPE